MKLTELLFESVLTTSQFKIEEIEDGLFKVKSISTSGLPVKVIKTMAFCEPTEMEFEYDDVGPYDMLCKAQKKLIGKVKTFTLTGKPIDSKMSWDSFKANGILVKGEKKDVEQLLKISIDYHNEEEAEKPTQAEKDARKKEYAKASSAAQRERIKNLELKYGKKTIGRVKIKQIGGDDGYQWNVIVDGRSIVNGLTKRSAEHEQEKEWQRLSKKDKVGTYGESK